MTIPVTFDFEGSIIIDDEIFNDVKIVGVDYQNNFLVLVYGPEGYHAHRVSTVYYGKDLATAELTKRNKQQSTASQSVPRTQGTK